jgi:hypothetical protein
MKAWRERAAFESLEQRLCFSALSFLPAKHYDAGIGSNAREVAVGDFNNDRKPDLVVADPGNDTVTVLLNKGGGAFVNNKTFSVSPLPFAVAVGDFNHDGADDLAVGGTGSESLQIYMGLGDGTFNVPVRYDLGLAPDSIAVADFNGDGRPDLAMTAVDSSYVDVMLNNGDGTFAPPTSYGIYGVGGAVIVDDFNGDRVWDLAVTSADSDAGFVNILFGNTITDPNDPEGNIPDGTFTPTEKYSVGKDPVSIAPGFPDFNGDASDDLAIANDSSGTVSVLLSDGSHTGEFNLPTDNVVGAGLTAVGVGDFSKSGHTDLAVAVGATVKIRLGNGDGTFQLPKSFPLSMTNGGALVVADFNADGRPDIAVTDLKGVSVLIAGQVKSGVISGYAFNDVNANGVNDPGDKRLANVRVYIDANKNGKLDTGEPSTLTDSSGNYAFKGLNAGTFRVAQVLKSGYRRTTPASGFYDVTLASGATASGKNFGNSTNVLISGTVFNDANGNGTKDSTEIGAGSGWTVYADINKDGKFDTGDVSATTDTSGNWSIKSLAAGTYVIRIAAKTGWSQTKPTANGGVTVTLSSGQTKSGVLFGEHKIA